MIRISIKWLIVLLLFALVIGLWLIDGGANRAKNTVGTDSAASAKIAGNQAQDHSADAMGERAST